MTRYHVPPDVVKPIRVTDDQIAQMGGGVSHARYHEHLFDSWERARLAAQLNAEKMVKTARAQLDRARSLKAVADALPVEEPTA